VPGARIPLLIVATILTLAALSFARDIVAPLALAAVLVVIVHPVRHPLERRGWPRWAANTVVIVVVYLILAVLAALLVFAAGRFTVLVGDYLDEIGGIAAATSAWLSSVGLDPATAESIVAAFDPARLLELAQGVTGWLLGFATAFFFVLGYVIFMAADGGRYSGADRRFPGHGRTVERIRSYNSAVRRYYVVNASFGAVVAVIDGLALWALGVPAPAVWAILAFVTNFIPNIGFVLGLVPPAVLAFVIGGAPLMLAVVAVYCVVNVVLQVLVQPKFVSDAVSISLTLSFFSVIFWTFVIGPLGALLSIPFTLLARELLIGEPTTARWWRWLSGDRDAVHAGSG